MSAFPIIHKVIVYLDITHAKFRDDPAIRTINLLFLLVFQGSKYANPGPVLCNYAQYIPWEAIYRIILISRVKLHVAKACAADHVRHWSNSVMCGRVKILVINGLHTHCGPSPTAGHPRRHSPLSPYSEFAKQNVLFTYIIQNL